MRVYNSPSLFPEKMDHRQVNLEYGSIVNIKAIARRFMHG